MPSAIGTGIISGMSVVSLCVYSAGSGAIGTGILHGSGPFFIALLLSYTFF